MYLTDRHLSIFWLYLVLVHSCFWFTVLLRFYLVNSSILALIYWIFRNQIPIITICSLYIEPPELKVKKIFYLVFIISFSFMIYGIAQNLSVQQLTGFKWSYHAIIPYLVFSLIYFEILRKKTTEFKALAISMFLCLIAGCVYDFPLRPFFIPFGHLYHVSFFTIINPRLVTIAFLFYLIVKSKWKWESKRGKKLFIIYFVFWLFLELLYGKFYNNFYFSYLIRIPTLILIAIIIKFLEKV